jgi:uncharacterized protein
MDKRPSESKDKKHLRMEPDQVFSFNCSPKVPCFTQCCRDVTIALTPYDVLRLKNALQITSDEFLDQYTVVLHKADRIIPLVALKMNEEDKKCALVSEGGCRVYEDRPWPCRMFPLDMNDDDTFCMISNSSRCLGLKAKESERIGDWLVGQGVPVYEEMNRLFTEITAPLRAQNLDIDNPGIYKMTFMALYNLDKFRDFIFKSSFLERFEIEESRIEKIKHIDLELLKFSYDWLKFGLFGQKTLWIRQEAVQGLKG